MDARKFTAVVGCMGRLPFLKATLPMMLQGAHRTCLVDYSCPDHCGDWAEREFGSSGRLVVVRVRNRKTFSKCRAYNAGVRHLHRRGLGGFLVFLDADTITPLSFWQWLAAHARPEAFYVVRPAPGAAQVAGVLAVAKEALLAAGGYDESLEGWGGQDVEMRVRLYLKQRMPFAEIPFETLDVIRHGDEWRTAYYADQDKENSRRRILAQVRKRAKQWTGREIRDLDDEGLTRLLSICGNRGLSAMVLLARNWKRYDVPFWEGLARARRVPCCWGGGGPSA